MSTSEYADSYDDMHDYQNGYEPKIIIHSMNSPMAQNARIIYTRSISLLVLLMISFIQISPHTLILHDWCQHWAMACQLLHNIILALT